MITVVTLFFLFLFFLFFLHYMLSDFPVEEVSPLDGIYAAISRQDKKGNPQGGWYADQRMTLNEAIRAFTVEPAYASFREHELGVLKPGFLADLTIIDGPLAEPKSLLERNIHPT